MSITNIYTYHVANLREIELAIKFIHSSLKEELKISGKNITLLLRLYALLIAAWAEVRLQKLLFENETNNGFGFNDTDRNTITYRTNNRGKQIERNQIERWKQAVELAFHKAFTTPLSPKEQEVHNKINMMLDTDLKHIISIRNKLAHGQLIYPLTKSMQLDTVLKNKIDNENILTLTYKYQLLSNLADMIHYLNISPPTLQRDYSKYISEIKSIKGRLDKGVTAYMAYENRLIQNHLINKEQKNKKN